MQMSMFRLKKELGKAHHRRPILYSSLELFDYDNIEVHEIAICYLKFILPWESSGLGLCWKSALALRRTSK